MSLRAEVIESALAGLAVYGAALLVAALVLPIGARQIIKATRATIAAAVITALVVWGLFRGLAGVVA